MDISNIFTNAINRLFRRHKIDFKPCIELTQEEIDAAKVRVRQLIIEMAIQQYGGRREDWQISSFNERFSPDACIIYVGKKLR